MKALREIVHFWEAHRGGPLALATLVAATGSSYRRPGARMLISAGGEAAGGVSAGCIEEEVTACAREVLRSGQARLLTFDTRARFGCHGAIEVLVEVVREEVLVALRECLEKREDCRLETIWKGDALGTRVAGFEDAADVFVQAIDPVLRLVVLGDSADVGALAAQAALLGWEVRTIEAAPVPPGLLDGRTAVVLATHNFGRDCALLRELLPAGLKYLGLIGSRRRRDDLLFDVMQNGVTMESALFAPAGLHLGADSPEEIALSIVAEIQSVFEAGSAQQLRHRKEPIHQPLAQPAACARSAA
jgi:xanthine dehydrogenase accessory factor